MVEDEPAPAWAMEPMPATLISLQREAEDIRAEIEEAFGEMTEELEARFLANAQALALKVDGYAFVLDMTMGRVDALLNMRNMIDARVKTLEDHHKRMLDVISAVMDHEGVDKLEGETFSFRKQRNPPAVEIVDEAAVKAAAPFCFQLEEIPGAVISKGKAYSVKLQKRVLKDYMLKKEGKEWVQSETVPGAVITQGTRIVVR